MDLFLSWQINSKTLKVKADLYPMNKKIKPIPVILLIDTGATRTAISRKFLKDLGYTNITKDSSPYMTGTGPAYFDMTKIARLELGGEVAFTNFNVHVLEWTNYYLHGVVGMDILSKLHIHSDTKIFRIQNKPFKIPPTPSPVHT
ncbi:MAG: retroviral-like aspartic protease family protein [Defluviitaleaceae bacterium]|nr:retroviral-like aspartic protease family protein [Defluviitaleaceae bacterium]